MSAGGGARPWILAIDTATSRIVVAAGQPDGTLLRALDWPAGHRHGERLLPGVEELLTATGLRLDGLVGVIVGTGPGAFTGLRVGLATAKGLAHSLSLPIVGISTGAALLAGSPRGALLLLPAGPKDRVEVRDGSAATLLPGGQDPAVDAGQPLVAVDLDGRAPADALALGTSALAALAENLIRLGSARLASGDADDVERLVPEYVTLPRGVLAGAGPDGDGGVAWSRDPR